MIEMRREGFAVVPRGDFLKLYAEWLRKETAVYREDGWHVFALPWADACGDWFQVYVRLKRNGKVMMTDDGYFMQVLHFSGIEGKSARPFQELFQRYGLVFVDGELTVIKNVKDWPEELHKWLRVFVEFDLLFRQSQKNAR